MELIPKCFGLFQINIEAVFFYKYPLYESKLVKKFYSTTLRPVQKKNKSQHNKQKTDSMNPLSGELSSTGIIRHFMYDLYVFLKVNIS